MTIEQLESEALALPETERVRLAQRLIASLDANELVDGAWYDEAERRLSAVESGRVSSMSADEVFAELATRTRR